MIIPKPLFTGARVALIAPSGPVPEGRLEPAVASVQALGLEPVVFPSCTMRHGYLAGYDRERAADFNNAFSDASIHGVICMMDEADEMLNMGFTDSINAILDRPKTGISSSPHI